MWYSSWSPDTVDHFVFIAWSLPHTYYRICFVMMEKSCESLWDANFTTWYSLPGQCVSLKTESCCDAMLSLLAPEFVFMTTYGAANNEKFGIMTTLFSKSHLP